MSDYYVIFSGGPREGKTARYPRNPRVIGCVDEWKAAGMKRGLYRDAKTGDGRRFDRTTTTIDGSTASYYELPQGTTQLQDLISHRNMNAQDGEIFRAIYRKGLASHSDALRDARKVLFYAQAEVKRLEAFGDRPRGPEWGKIEYWEQLLGCLVDTVEIRPPFRQAHVVFRPAGAGLESQLRARLREFGVEIIGAVQPRVDRAAIMVQLPDAVTHT